MRISTRLMLGLGYLAALLVLLGVVGLMGLSTMARAIDVVVQENYAAVVAARGMNEAMDRQDGAVYATVLGDVTGFGERRLASGRVEFDASLRAARASAEFASPEEISILQQISDERRAYDATVVKLMELAGSPAAVALYYSNLEPRYERLKHLLHDLQETRDRGIQQAKEEARRLTWTSRAWIGILTAVVLMSLLWMTGHFRRTIVVPLSSMAEVAHELGRGELQRRLHHPRKDELGELALRFNELADQLQELKQREVHAGMILDQTLEALLDRFGEPLAILDGQGTLAHANGAFRKALSDGSTLPTVDLEGLGARYRVERHVLDFRGVRTLGDLVRLEKRKSSGAGTAPR